LNDLIKPFSHHVFGSLRVLSDNDEPKFNLYDVAFSLGYTKLAKGHFYLRKEMIENICSSLEIKGLSPADNHESVITRFTDFNNTYIAESDLYDLTLESKAKNARDFRKWVTSEIIPTIRKHGAYMTPETIEKALYNPDFIINLATELKSERSARIEAEKTVQVMKPKALFADSVADSDSLILINDLAKIMKQNGLNIGGRRLFQWMRDNGYLIKRHGTDYNMPTQKSMELGLFRIKETAVTHSNGYITVSKTPKVTGKGQVYFTNKLMKESAPVVVR
jgi:anti-repressor protein